MSGLVVVGDALLDRDLVGRADRLCPDAPVPVVSDIRTTSRAGGAGLAASLAARDGRRPTLITALGADDAGTEVAALLAADGVEVVDLGCEGATAAKVRVRAGEHAVVRLDSGGTDAGTVGPLTAGARDALAAATVVLVSDYGRGLTASADVRAELATVRPGRQIVWDPHPRGAPPVPGCRLVTPNEAEAFALAALTGPSGLRAVAAAAHRLVARWQASGVVVTLGARGALLGHGDGPPLVVPAPPAVGDPCGAGDRFASALAGALADGAVASEAVTVAVLTASEYVRTGGVRADAGGDDGARPPADGTGVVTLAEAAGLADRVRVRGGTVVATGGCFDLLHTGHAQVLAGARRLGDCLVVLLNSDRSARGLKGPGRPVVPARDRAALVAALGSVDAVVVFDEDTPCAALEQLRPDVFVKGGDYGAAALPEEEVMARWGGQCVVLPYLAGRSTTSIMQEVHRRGVA